MYITNEFTVLTKGNETITIKPGVKYDTIPEGYNVSCSAMFRDEKGEVVAIFNPGQLSTKLETAIKKSQPSVAPKKTKTKDVLIQAELPLEKI